MKHSIDWPTLQALLEDDDRRAAIEYTYPAERRDSFLQATRHLAPISTRWKKPEKGGFSAAGFAAAAEHRFF